MKMKNSKIIKHVLFLLAISAGFLLVQSCVVYQGYRVPPVTVSEIVQMSKDSIPAKEIISKIQNSHTVYRLKADQLAELKKEGVSSDVINYMEQTHLEAVRQNQQLEDLNYWWPGWDGYWYGGPAFGWPNNYWNYNWGAGVHFDHDHEGGYVVHHSHDRDGGGRR